MSTPLLSSLTALPHPLPLTWAAYHSPGWARTSLVSSLAPVPFAVAEIGVIQAPRVLTSGFGWFLLLYTEFRYIFSEHFFPKHFCKRATDSPLSNYLYFLYCFGIPQFGRIIMLSGGIKYERLTAVILLLPAGITPQELNL